MCRIQSWCRMIQSICGQRQGRMNISFTWTSKRHLRRAPFHVRWGLERRAKALSRSPWRPSVTTSSSSFEGTRAGCWCWSECHGSPFDGPVFLSPHSFSGVCGTPACVRDMRWGFHVEPTDVVPFSATISLVSCCWFSFQGSPGSLWFVELCFDIVLAKRCWSMRKALWSMMMTSWWCQSPQQSQLPKLHKTNMFCWTSPASRYVVHFSTPQPWRPTCQLIWVAKVCRFVVRPECFLTRHFVGSHGSKLYYSSHFISYSTLVPHVCWNCHMPQKSL